MDLHIEGRLKNESWEEDVENNFWWHPGNFRVGAPIWTKFVDPSECSNEEAGNHEGDCVGYTDLEESKDGSD
jgi:hypothetical protein